MLAISRALPQRHCGRTLRLRRSSVAKGGEVQGATTEQSTAPDCLQRPLLRRSRFRQQVSASVRLPSQHGRRKFGTPGERRAYSASQGSAMHTMIGSIHGDQRYAGGRRTHTTRGFRTFGCIVTLVLGLLVPLAAEAQQPMKVHRIGHLSAGASAPSQNLEAFRQGLRDLGYVEGHNLVIEHRWAEGKAGRLPNLAAELVRLPVDVIVAGGVAIRAVQQATSTIPIVMVGGSGDPVAAGLIASRGQPGGNITGLS